MRRSAQRRAAVFACYEREVTGKSVGELVERLDLGDDERQFVAGLVDGVDEVRAELDRQIAEHAVNWTVERIAPLERCILRVALYEMLYREEIPTEVSIDEAVELAKHYCGVDAPGFINGILGAVAEVDKQEGHLDG